MSHTTDTTAPKRPAPPQQPELASQRNRYRRSHRRGLRYHLLDLGYRREPAAKTALVAAPELRPLIAGAWLLGGTLGGLLIRKPGAALFCELVAALISVLFTGGAWSGEILISGIIQGIGAEIVFAAFGYRRWNAAIAVLAGALSGLFMGGSEILIYYPDMEPVKAVTYVVCSVVSGAVIAGFLAWILVQNLAKTGVLSSLASGNTRR